MLLGTLMSWDEGWAQAQGVTGAVLQGPAGSGSSSLPALRATCVHFHPSPWLLWRTGRGVLWQDKGEKAACVWMSQRKPHLWWRVHEPPAPRPHGC